MSHLSSKVISKLRNNINGSVILPGDSQYNEARTIWNGMIDRHPAVIVRCKQTEDVPYALRFAKANNLVISILGGGHHIAGNSIADDGLVIDFSEMNSVRVDTKKRRAFVEPGATLADLDKATQAYGLATPTGINSTTGIAGLTLGGGFGWLTRKHGLTIDNLISATVVTTKGQTLTVDKTQNADLFWAIRGGGGNFGIVTEFEFKLHPVGPEIQAGMIVFPFTEAKKVLQNYNKFVQSIPEELNVLVIMRPAPPLPFLPEAVHGKMVVVLAAFYDGDISRGKDFFALLRNIGNPVGEHIGTQPYVAWQQAFDPLLTPGARNYWKSHNFTKLNSQVFDKIITYAGKMPSQQCEIFIANVEGAQNNIPADATAYVGRDAKFIMNVHARWESEHEDKNCISWARNFFEETKPYASSGGYVNFMTDDEQNRVSKAYGKNYDRLVKLKSKYDPENILHMNQNIRPKLVQK